MSCDRKLSWGGMEFAQGETQMEIILEERLRVWIVFGMRWWMNDVVVVIGGGQRMLSSTFRRLILHL